jgi:hypothetical protein
MLHEKEAVRKSSRVTTGRFEKTVVLPHNSSQR